MADAAREFDIIVYGATGYTGRLVAAHLLKTYGASGDIAWAMAGRSAGKMAEVRDKMGAPASLPLVVAANEAKAKASGARIVFSCGFDSIPFDLGVFFLEEKARAKFGAPVSRVRGRARGIH